MLTSFSTMTFNVPLPELTPTDSFEIEGGIVGLHPQSAQLTLREAGLRECSEKMGFRRRSDEFGVGRWSNLLGRA